MTAIFTLLTAITLTLTLTDADVCLRVLRPLPVRVGLTAVLMSHVLRLTHDWRDPTRWHQKARDAVLDDLGEGAHTRADDDSVHGLRLAKVVAESLLEGRAHVNAVVAYQRQDAVVAQPVVDEVYVPRQLGMEARRDDFLEIGGVLTPRQRWGYTGNSSPS